MKYMRNEAALNRAKRTVIHLIKIDKMSLEDIAETTELPLNIVKKLEIEVMQLA